MEFRQSRAGRQLNMLSLLAALVVWVFALWMFGASLNLRFTRLTDTLAMLPERSASQLVPAFLMVALIVALPLLVWSMLVELWASYLLEDEGLRFRSLGASIFIPWAAVRVVRPGAPGGEPAAEVLVGEPLLRQIQNPLMRLLYRSAFGGGRLPIYRSTTNSELLIAEIRRRAGAGS